jgi:hypothetical protein
MRGVSMAKRNLGVGLGRGGSIAEEAAEGKRYQAPTLEKKVLLSAITAALTPVSNVSSDSSSVP